MPNLSELQVDWMECPACRSRTVVPGGTIDFQGGMIPYRYRVGDPVVWLRDRRGRVVPPFRVRKMRRLWGLLETRYPWNYGEPRYENLFAFDADPNLTEYHCSHCSLQYERIAARVRGGVFHGAAAFLPGELENRLGEPLGEADVALVREDGNYWIPEEWKEPEIDLYEE